MPNNIYIFFVRNCGLLLIDIGHVSISIILYTGLTLPHWRYFKSLTMTLIYLKIWAKPCSSIMPLFFKLVAIPLSSNSTRDKISFKSFLLLPAIFVPIHSHVASIPLTFAIQTHIALYNIYIILTFYCHPSASI